MIYDESPSEVRKRTAILKSVWEDTRNRKIKYVGNPTVITECKFKRPSSGAIISIRRESNCISLAHRVLSSDPERKVLIITVACNTNIGGGVENGIISSEADLCRRTNYYSALKKLRSAEKINYPLQPQIHILTPGITVVKNGPTYKELKQPFVVDILSTVLPRRPSVINIGPKEMYERDSDKDKTQNCIDTILNIAAKNDYDTLIIDKVGFSDKHPIDAFIDLLKSTLPTCGIELIYYIIPYGEDRDSHDVFKKYYTLDNTENPQCDSSSESEVEPEPINITEEELNAATAPPVNYEYDVQDNVDTDIIENITTNIASTTKSKKKKSPGKTTKKTMKTVNKKTTDESVDDHTTTPVKKEA